MTFGQFCTRTGAVVSVEFYEKVIQPMYMAAPDTIDITVFCKMFTRHSLELAETAWRKRESI